MTQNKQRESNDKQAKARKAYVAPKLTVYGNVREFTRGGGGTNADKEEPQV